MRHWAFLFVLAIGAPAVGLMAAETFRSTGVALLAVFATIAVAATLAMPDDQPGIDELRRRRPPS